MSILANSREGVLAGYSQGSRADEFQRATPMLLGQLNDNDFSSKSILALPNILENNFVGNVLLNPENVIFRLFPNDFAFSAIWWFPVFFLFVTVYVTLNLFTRKIELIIPASIVIVFSPGIMWWSNMPALVLSKIISAGLLTFYLLCISKKQFVRVLAALWAGGLVTSAILTYAPLAIGFLFGLLPIFGLLLQKYKLSINRQFYNQKLPALMTMLIAPIFIYFSEKPQLNGLANTVYPGDRSFNSGKIDGLKWIFSGTFDSLILDRRQIISVNQSEFSLGFGIFVILIFFTLLNLKARKDKVLKVFLFSILFFQLFWILISADTDWIPVFNRVSPERMGLALSISAPITYFVILLNNLDSFVHYHRRNKILITFVVMLFSTNSAFYVCSQVVFNLKIYVAFLIITCLGFGTWLMQNSNPKIIKKGMYIFGILALASSAPINPISSGTTAIYETEPSGIISSTPKSAVWASDNFVGDAYLMSLSRKSVSGQQLTGPNKELWGRFDPNLASEKIWNKGQSYVLFSWQPISEVIFREEQPDQINIQINPCNPILDTFNVQFIIASTPLNEYQCVKLLHSQPIDKPNGPMWLYARQG